MKITAITPFPPSHVAGIIAGDGTLSGGHIQGIAPQGKGRLSAMLEGIRWLKENWKRLGIQIVNISVGSVKKQKENSQLVQAVESLWDSGLVICSAAGNEGMQQHNITSPGISRKIITVGSCDDKEMIDEGGRFYHNYSGRGPTIACICKPEIVAPGTNIVATNAMKGEDDKHVYAYGIWCSSSFVGALSKNDKYKCEAKALEKCEKSRFAAQSSGVGTA